MSSPATQSQGRIGQLFARLQVERRAALIAYLTAGDPTLDRTPGIVAALERGGADLIELGVPFSDPIADGPVIQRGVERALASGTTLKGVLECARRIRQTSAIPLLLFTYLNPALRYGLDALATDAAQAGIDGVLFTDLSVEEAARYLPALRAHKLDTVFLAAPTSTPQRLRLTADYSAGFIYLVSRTGVTGEQQQLSSSIQTLVDSMRAFTQLPLAVGFGISTPDQAAAVGAIADGVVVGSAFVRIVEQYGQKPELEASIEAFASALRQALPLRDLAK